MGYCLGIYGEVTRNDLRRLKNIRNVFAHSPRTITFETPEVASLCLELRYLDNLPGASTFCETNPRQIFFETVRMLILDLHAIGFPKSDKRHLEKMP